MSLNTTFALLPLGISRMWTRIPHRITTQVSSVGLLRDLYANRVL